MAVTLKDISVGLQKYAQRQQQQTAKESYNKDELLALMGAKAVPPDVVTKPTGAGVSADVVAEKSVKISEEQSKEIKEVNKSVADDSSDGLLSEQKKQTQQLEDLNEFQKEQLAALLKLGKSFETFKSPMEKLANKLQAYSPENFKETILEKMNIKLPLIGGIFDKAIAKERFIKQERLLGSTKTRSEISRDFKSYNEQSKIIQKNSATISKIKAALPDASDEQLMKVPEYARAKQESETAAKESGKFTVKSSIMNPTNEDVGSTTKKQPNKRTPQPASGTKPSNISPTTVARQKEPTSTGGIFDKVQKVGAGMVGMAKGIAAMGGALIVLTLGLKAISEVSFESIAKATVAIGGLVVVSKLLGDNTGSMLKGALGIAALGGALLIAGEGFKTFAELDWEALAKAGVAVGGLALAAAGIGAFVGPILLGAAAIAGIGASVWVLAKGIDALANAMDRIRSPKAANKPADGAAPVEQPTTAVKSEAQPETKTSSAVTGSKEAYKQTYDKRISEGRAPFAAKMLADKEHGLTGTGASASTLPSVGRAQPTTANAVYGASAENAEAATVANAGTTNNVVAPTTVTNTTNQMGGYKPDVRNQDSSFKRMLDNRYVPV